MLFDELLWNETRTCSLNIIHKKTKVVCYIFANGDTFYFKISPTVNLYKPDADALVNAVKALPMGGISLFELALHLREFEMLDKECEHYDSFVFRHKWERDDAV